MIPEYTIAIDNEGRAYQLVKDYFHDELRWQSWVESPEGDGWPLTALELTIVGTP